MASKDELERWWEGLTGQEQADAIRSRDAGQLSDAMEKSLKKAGVMGQEKRKDRTIPDDVFESLKMRH